jgi:hypothetical protein
MLFGRIGKIKNAKKGPEKALLCKPYRFKTAYQEALSIINLCMSAADLLPAPIALMTVAAPVMTSPPAQTLGLVVRPVASSATVVPH